MTKPPTGTAGHKLERRVVDEASAWQARLENPGPGDREAFTRWIESAEQNREAFDAVRANWALSERIVEGPAGQHRKLVRAPFYMRRSTHVAAGTLAAALLAVGITVAVFQMDGPAVIASARAATFETAIGEIRTVTLRDGTQVTLDTASLLRTDAGDSRRVELVRGRARFTVARSPRAFTVALAAGSVRSAASTFDVSLLASRPIIAAIEGDTQVGATPPGSGGILLSEGHQVEMASSGNMAALSKGELLWTKGMLVFDAAPLGDAVAAMNRYNAAQIIGPDQASAYRVTGAFSARDPASFSQAVAALFDLEAVRTSDGTWRLRGR